MFQCEQCGSCCRQIGSVFFAREMALPDGSCKHLNKETNLCMIYKDRPIFCRVDDFYNKFLSDKMSLEEFYNQNKEVCKRLRTKINN